MLDIDSNTPAVLAFPNREQSSTKTGESLIPRRRGVELQVAQTACPSHTVQTNGPPWYREDGERGRARIGGVSAEGGRTGGTEYRENHVFSFFSRSRTYHLRWMRCKIDGLLEIAYMYVFIFIIYVDRSWLLFWGFVVYFVIFPVIFCI